MPWKYGNTLLSEVSWFFAYTLFRKFRTPLDLKPATPLFNSEALWFFVERLFLSKSSIQKEDNFRYLKCAGSKVPFIKINKNFIFQILFLRFYFLLNIPCFKWFIKYHFLKLEAYSLPIQWTLLTKIVNG